MNNTVYLSDYSPAGWLIDKVNLTFKLHPTKTRVHSRIEFRPNPDCSSRAFFLNGEDLTLINVTLDGAPLAVDLTDEGLTATVPDRPFVFEAEVEINPEENTALDGLYMSNGMYCTQCEAQGFRRITYYSDRPDVMAPFDVRIEGDQPVMLSNGNPVSSATGFAEWTDPWPKPAYLFALVAGDLVARNDHFTTMSGRDVSLKIWVRPGDEDKTEFSMNALKSSMKWDEEVYGREYDLDLFQIVAVSDFNMGAMENKGLNIFNSSAVLAHPDTTIDVGFERIESIIAHEYFHNWTGNRITCRDWFQLSLKEGLTVFRDQQFSADMRSEAVCRINDVLELRDAQFREDNGPLAHQVQPDSFVEINNFYTKTIYNKGAELIRMMKTLVGDQAYYQALDLYFTRHDGQAVTIEDWVRVFEDCTERDLTQFRRWYKQAGTPRLTVKEHFENGCLRLVFSQHTPPTPSQSDKRPQHIPVAIGLLDQSGTEILSTQIVEVTEAQQEVSFENLPKRPVVSILRNFSAPVFLQYQQSDADKLILFKHDKDSFNRWEAARHLALDILAAPQDRTSAKLTQYLEALTHVLADPTADAAQKSLFLRLPSEEEITQYSCGLEQVVDPQKVYRARENLSNAVAEFLGDNLHQIFDQLTIEESYQPNAAQAGKRALALEVLALISRLDHGKLAAEIYANADNMTMRSGALSCLLAQGFGQDSLAHFYETYQNDELVMNRWFALQVLRAPTENALDVVRSLTKHVDFHWKNPNRFRAVIGSFAQKLSAFHRADGEGYAFLADWVLTMDQINPQAASSAVNAFATSLRYDDQRQTHMRRALSRINAAPNLSKNTSEMVDRILAG